MDNVTNIEPADNEERLPKGILEGDTETNIEPAGNKERLLKGILEKLGGGGGATSVTLAASGDNLSGDISLADLKTALSSGVVLLSFPTDGNADERVVAEYTDDSTNGLRIGVFSEDEYIVYSVVDDGNDGVTLTVVSEDTLGEDVIIVPTFTSLTGGTVPAGTYNKVLESIHHGRMVTVDTSAVIAAAPGTQLTQFNAEKAVQGGSDYIALRAFACGIEHGNVLGIAAYEVTLNTNDTFTLKMGDKTF